MDEIANEIADGRRFQIISSGQDSYYRLWHNNQTTVLKVYGASSTWRRENRAIGSLYA